MTNVEALVEAKVDAPPRVGFSKLQAWLIAVGVILVAAAVAVSAVVLALGVSNNEATGERNSEELVTLSQVVALLEAEEASDDVRACNGAHAAAAALRELFTFDAGLSEIDREALRIFRDRFVSTQCREQGT